MRRLLCLAICLAAGGWAASPQTALDRYVAKPDSSYKYELVETIPGKGYTVFVLNLTSQTWRSAAEVDRPEWRHWLTIIKPAEVKHPTGFLFITGGAVQSKPPAQPPANLTAIAVDTGTVVSELRMVPNQPVTFAGETTGRTEDSFSWERTDKAEDLRKAVNNLAVVGNTK